jgi:hypothetical protein
VCAQDRLTDQALIAGGADPRRAKGSNFQGGQFYACAPDAGARVADNLGLDEPLRSSNKGVPNMKLTRALFLALAFLIPAVSTVAKAEDKPAGEAAAPAEGKKAKKAKKSKKAEEKKEGEAAAPAPAEKK